MKGWKTILEIFNTSPHPPPLLWRKKTPVFGSEISHPIQVLTGKILDPDLTSLSVTKQKRKIRVYFPAIHNYKLKKNHSCSWSLAHSAQSLMEANSVVDKLDDPRLMWKIKAWTELRRADPKQLSQSQVWTSPFITKLQALWNPDKD